ncbi:hypothetical protein HanXRQr2_Chr05g0222171 [Helianthus annuus]|uniref:Uncharacterized protein n=1 Tax=Helianthus annuus TaxID=4232 RepID=A0A9K3J0C2_HELAN|nr:hypothetical protein HanXRQr2_Chr05g0222171 [Helianthus annuus]KAJ0923317.1 hypothetical protein HanPSC8_Chr05g0214481 [Helianthus annuus]
MSSTLLHIQDMSHICKPSNTKVPITSHQPSLLYITSIYFPASCWAFIFIYKVFGRSKIRLVNK